MFSIPFFQNGARRAKTTMEPPGPRGQDVGTENPGQAARIPALCWSRSLLKCQAGPFLPQTLKDGRFDAREKPPGENCAHTPN